MSKRPGTVTVRGGAGALTISTTTPVAGVVDAHAYLRIEGQGVALKNSDALRKLAAHLTAVAAWIDANDRTMTTGQFSSIFNDFLKNSAARGGPS